MPIRSLSRLLQLPIRLIQQILRLRGMSLHVKLIRLLRSRNLRKRLLRQPLRRIQVRMLLPAGVIHRLTPGATLPRRSMLIGSMRSLFQFVVRLIQQVLGLRRMPSHIKLIGLLRIRNPMKRLIRQSLCSSKVRMPARVHIPRRSLCQKATS